MTKNGTPATPVYDANLGATLYWGILPGCNDINSSVAASLDSCPGPCILKRDKIQGSAVMSFYLPYPWDAKFHGG